MESSYSNLDHVSSSLTEAEIVWLDHCYASSKDSGFGGNPCPWKQEPKEDLTESKFSEQLTILPFKTKKSAVNSNNGTLGLQNRDHKRILPKKQIEVSQQPTDIQNSNNSVSFSKTQAPEVTSDNKFDVSTQADISKPKHILRATYFAGADSENLDIVSCTETSTTLADNPLGHDDMKVRVSLSEMERSVRFIRKSDPGWAWETKIDKYSWTSMQLSLFKQISRLLNDDTIKRCVYQNDSDAGPIHVLNIIRQSSQTLRDIFAGFCFWDIELIDWLHCLLCNSLNNQYLVVYLQLLQNLKLDIPSLIQGIIDRNKFKISSLTPDFWVCLNRRLVDPAVTVAAGQEANVPKSFDSTQVIVIPNLAVYDRGTQQKAYLKRFRSYVSQMTAIGKVTAVNVQTSSDLTSTPENYLTRTVTSVHSKLAEMKQSKVVKRVILVGFGLGSLVCSMVAAEAPEKVSACVCIGIPLRSINGNHSSIEDSLAQVKCPVLFVVGEMSKMCLLDDLEDLRQNMISKQTAVIVVDGCNDNLVIGHKKAFEHKITQSMLDKFICSEITSYLTTIFKTDYSISSKQQPISTNDLSKQPQTTQEVPKLAAQSKKLVSSGGMTSKMSDAATQILQKVAERHRKQQAQQDDESSAAANLLENLLESNAANPSSTVPFNSVQGSNASSREVSPSRIPSIDKKRPVGNRHTNKLDEITSSEGEESSDSGDSFASSNYAEMRKFGESMMTSKMNVQLYNQRGKTKRKLPSSYPNKSAKMAKASTVRANQLPQRKPEFNSLSYSEDLISGSI